MCALPICRVNGYFRGQMRYIGKGVQRLLNRAKCRGAVIRRDAVQALVLVGIKREADVGACCEYSLDALHARRVAYLAELLERPRATFVSAVSKEKVQRRDGTVVTVVSGWWRSWPVGCPA